MRRPAVALVPAALVAPAKIAAAFVAPTLVTIAFIAVALEFIPPLVPALAFKTLARRTALILTCRCALGRRRGRGVCRRALAGFSEILMAAAAAMLLAWRSLAAFTCGGRLRAILRAGMLAPTMAVAIMARRATFLGTATGTPDFDQLRLGRRFRRGCTIGRRSFAAGSGLRRCGFAADRGVCRGLNDELILWRSFSRHLGDRLGRRRDGFRLALDFGGGGRRFGSGRERDFGQQRHRRRGIAGIRQFGGDFCRRRFRRGFRGNFDRRRLGGHRFHLRNRLRLRRQWRTAIHAIAERAQDRGKIFAGRSRQRGHRLRHDKAAAIERARGFFAG